MKKVEEFFKKSTKEEISKLLNDECYGMTEFCNLIDINPTSSAKASIRECLKKLELSFPYPKVNSLETRILKRYEAEMCHWWDNEKLSNIILDKLKNNLVINYADKSKLIARYVIAVIGHPRASKSNQVKAHIILWEWYNKQLFPENYVLVPKDSDFCNLDINNFEFISNEDYRSRVALGERNHFYTTGSQNGVCYKGGWKTITKKFITARGACEICGCKEHHKLNTHHIISYHLFEKPKDAHESQNLICLCDSCHQSLHLGNLNLSGFLSEKVKSNLLELLEQLQEKYTNDDKLLLVKFSKKSISSQASY